METNRQKKIAKIIQKDLAELLQHAAQEGMHGVIISVTKVSVTSDLSLSKAYLSIFPTNKKEALFAAIKSNTQSIRYDLAQRTKHQLRRMPELTFYLDDSLDYIENIDALLRGEVENPIKNPDILPKRKRK